MLSQDGIFELRRSLCSRFVTVAVVVGCVAVPGCTGLSKSRTDVVEIQLRQQRSENEGLRRELEATRQALASTRRKTNALRDAGDGESGAVSRVSTSNDSAVTPQLDRIEIRSLLTGGLDRDAIPGDELLSVLVTPVDQSGTPVRPDGMLSVTAFDYSLPKDRQQVGRWEWDTQATESLWMAGVLATGYRFTGAWDTPPVTDSIVLHARFVTPNGEQFDATEKVSVDAVPIRTADQTGSLLEG